MLPSHTVHRHGFHRNVVITHSRTRGVTDQFENFVKATTFVSVNVFGFLFIYLFKKNH